MPLGPEDMAREQIDRMLELSGWAVQDAKAVNLYTKQGVAICEFEQEVLNFVEFGRAENVGRFEGRANVQCTKCINVPESALSRLLKKACSDNNAP